MLRHELVRQMQADAALGAHRAGHDDEQIEAARDLPAPQVAGGGRPPVVRAEGSARAADGARRFDDLRGVHARLRCRELRRERRVQLFQRGDEVVEGDAEIGPRRAEVAAPVDPPAHERAIVEIFLQQHVHHREQQRAFGARVRGQPEIGFRRRVRQPRIDHDERGALRLALDDPLRVRVEVVARLQVRREQQDRLRVRVIGRWAIVAAPEEVAEPRRRRADVRVAVVAVDAPRLQHAVGVAVLAGAADVIHDFVAAVLDDRAAEARGDVVERLVPRHLLPAPAAALALALQRIQNPVGILELIRRDDALRACAPAAAGMRRVALDLADGEALLVDVGEDAARRLAVETDARNDPVVALIFPRPARRLVVDVVVPRRRIWVRFEPSHDKAGSIRAFVISAFVVPAFVVPAFIIPAFHPCLP